MKQLTSLLLVEERLLEAEHFALLLNTKYPLEIQFYLNAFLSAARSVTFLVQKELAHTKDFSAFWSLVQAELREDPAARFFLELRNFSQKAGRVSIEGAGGILKPHNYVHPEVIGEEPFMVYKFASREIEVPAALVDVELTTACLLHLSKLAKVTLKTMSEFPFDTCPSQACSADGATHWNLELSDFLEILGFPRDWVAASEGLSRDEAFSLISSQLDAVDRKTIERIARYSEELSLG